MGRTNPTYRDRIDALEREWGTYRRGLRAVDQDGFDRLFEHAREYAHAAGYLNHPTAEFPLLVSILLAHERRHDRLEDRLEALETRVDTLEGRLGAVEERGVYEDGGDVDGGVDEDDPDGDVDDPDDEDDPDGDDVEDAADDSNGNDGDGGDAAVHDAPEVSRNGLQD